MTKTNHAPNNCYHQWDLLQISSSSSSSLLAKFRFAMSRFWFLEFTFREHYAFGTWLYMRRRRLCWLCNSKCFSFFLHDPNTSGHFTVLKVSTPKTMCAAMPKRYGCDIWRFRSVQFILWASNVEICILVVERNNEASEINMNNLIFTQKTHQAWMSPPNA